MSTLPRDLPSYGRAGVPREAIRRALEKTANRPGFASISAHARMTGALARQMAERLAEKGVAINPELPEVAHWARAAARPLRGDARIATTDVRVERHYLEKLGARKLGELVSKYRGLATPETLRGLKSEDVPFLLAGYLIRGVRKPDGSVEHRAWLPREALRILKEEQGANREQWLENEYRNGIAPLLAWVEKRGMSVRGLLQEFNERLASGEFSVGERKA